MLQHLPQIIATTWRQQSLILTAEPGSGKTTRVPWALAQDPCAPANKQIWVLEPRRLAARMAAQFVAAGLGEPVGQRIGYRVRHDDVTGPKTRVVYMTEGLLWRTMLGSPTLAQASCIVFDEFHGRTLAGDLMLAALAHRRRQGLSTPAIVVMSATLAHEDVRRLLPDAPHIHVAGRAFPVTVQHSAPGRDRLEAQVAGGVAQVLAGHIATPEPVGQGHILTFVPGMADIDRAMVACRGIAQRHALLMAPLHASLHASEQDRAVAPSTQRKLVLATNVAETSLTIEGVTHVIDSGLAKRAEVDPCTGIGRLRTATISQAAAIQRAGRAGRTGPGVCLRLYTAAQFRLRQPFEAPEMVRSDLSEAVLWLAALGLPGLGELLLIDSPPQEAVHQAETTLTRLGAWGDGRITSLGQQLLQFAVHPRLGRIVLAGHIAGITDLACQAAAVLSLGRAAAAPHAGRTQPKDSLGHSDLLPMVRPQAMSPEAKRTAAGLRAACKTIKVKPRPGTDAETRLDEALLVAFSDRLVRRLPPLGARVGPLPLALGWGGQGTLSADSCVRDSGLMLALMAGDRGGDLGRVMVDVAHSIAPESLIALDDGRLLETTQVVVSAQHGRVEKVETLSYDGLTVDESRSQHVSMRQAQEALGAWLSQNPKAALTQVVAHEGYAVLVGRLSFIASSGGLADVPMFAGLGDPESSSSTWTAELGVSPLETQLHRGLLHVLKEASASCRSTGQLLQQPLFSLLVQGLTPTWQQALRNQAPTSIRLTHNRELIVHYPAGQPPYVGSYLQDFFGCAVGPTLGPGRLPLTLHLWGPNKRPLQVTQDLASFWRVHYPKLRPALARKYPRHAWPEDPLHAEPPAPRAPKRR